MQRRELLIGAVSASVVCAASRGIAQSPHVSIPIGDMHFHSYFGSSKYHSRPVAPMMAAGGATLVAWSFSGDLLFVDWTRYKQKVEPKPGEALAWFEREIDRVKAHCAEQGLKIALKAEDVDRAVRGEPHIVLAVEGATFIDRDLGPLHRAYELGIRHLQLVHYTRSPLGDIQTDAASHNGLGPLGKEVVQECNRLGILIDLAHGTPLVVRDTLALSKSPVVWSHSSVSQGPPPHPGMTIWRARQLSLETARMIAKEGGVVGLWVLTSDVGRTIEAYADRVAELAGWIGEDHVAFGTDINGLGQYAILSTYGELRHVIERWQNQKMPETRTRKLAIGNYARVLKAAMQRARA